MRALLKPLVVPLLRRRDDEVIRRAEAFQIASRPHRELVTNLGAAFLGGYHAMLSADGFDHVVRAAVDVDVHFRPFFFEGAAMGYLPRGYWDRRCTAQRAERDLLGMNPDYLYLYYVGIGFWYGFRHPRRPERLQELAGLLDPVYFPLCYDGFGFKLGFFDHPDDPAAVRLLERVPSRQRPFAYQGFGRSMFFVHMDDEPGFEALADALPEERRCDLEIGRSLARGFTGIDRPDACEAHALAADDPGIRTARLAGMTWALTARSMNDRDYFERCMGRASDSARSRLEVLPEVCNRLRSEAESYEDWQASTRQAVADLYDKKSGQLAGQ